jgi:DNA-binding MarR family transcriptional regulator
MSTPPDAPWIGAILRLVWQAVREQIGQTVRGAGFHDVTQAHISLFRYPGLDGTRPTKLAEELQISKQAINDLLRDLEQRGYIQRVVDPLDRRSRLIRLTPHGANLENTILDAARDAEAELARQLGTRRFRAMRQALLEALALLNTDQPTPTQPSASPQDARLTSDFGNQRARSSTRS